jgi:hypothetical protein
MNATSIPRNLYSVAWQTMALGPIQGWNTVRRAIFHQGRCCERARVIDGASPNWAAYRAANSPRCQKPLESAHARCLCLRRPAPYQRVDRRIGIEGVFPSVVIDWSCLSALRIGANRRRTDWRALSPAFAQEGNLFTIQTPTRRKRALNVWGFNSCGAFGNKHGGKNTGELHPDQIKGAVDRNYRVANRWRAYRADNRRRCGSRAPH